MKVQCVDHLDNTDAPLILDAYMYLLGVQSLVSLSDGPTRYTFSTTHSRSKNHLQVQPSWPALLASLSFLLTMKPSNSIFGDILGAPQTLARAASLALLTRGLQIRPDGFVNVNGFWVRIVTRIPTYVAHRCDAAGTRARAMMRSPSDLLPTPILTNSPARLPPLTGVHPSPPPRLHPRPSQPPFVLTPHDVSRRQFLLVLDHASSRSLRRLCRRTTASPYASNLTRARGWAISTWTSRDESRPHEPIWVQ
ncbi:hypothetical protein BGY98DRAFT_596197 [Russula aff. rugulosa BPL654]|nr:hypothetical protein BGY98DRAFT_596197 [Russula aff. rugulosa BPL654]